MMLNKNDACSDIHFTAKEQGSLQQLQQCTVRLDQQYRKSLFAWMGLAPQTHELYVIA